MKRQLKTTFASFAVLAALTACSVTDPLEPDDSKIPDKPQEEQPSGDLVLTATLESQNKTAWATADKVLVFDGKSTATVSPSATSATASLNCPSLKKGAEYYIGWWPASDNPTFGDNTISIEVPKAQKASETVYDIVRLAAKTHSDKIAFDDVFSYVGFSTSMDGIEKITFSTDATMAGKVLLKYDSTSPTVSVSDGSGSIEVSGPFEKGKTYYFLTVPGFNGELNAVASSSKKSYSIKAETVDFMVGKVNTVPVLDEPCPLKGIYKMSHMWVYGGTGQEYGGGGVKDLFACGNFFVSSLGRGIEAEKDNFIEVLQDGTMYNWAGDDGKNCRFVWKSSENRKQNGYPKELESFFRKVPKGQSAVWMDDLGVVTITCGDGSTVKGQYCPAGTYHNYSETAKYDVTITTAAIRFTVTGGTDDWTNLWNYQTWDIVACHPRTLYIELEPMGAGFTVPSSSKTSETIPDDEVLDPDEPIHSSFDFSTLIGTWGFNTVASDCVVLGGCGSDPAFVGPVDKSWDWDDSIWKLGDDRLTISVDGADFYFNYWSGNDGQFWNYTWKSTGEDLSRYYGLLPKGKHKVSFNFDTFVATFDNGTSCKFLVPGVYQFSEWKKEAVIDDGCFGIWFDFNAPAGGYPENSTHWTDVDRFVTSPYGYLMKFHKK